MAGEVTVRTRPGRLFEGDVFVDVAELRAPTLAQLEQEIGHGQAPEMWNFIAWAREQFPYKQEYACTSREHALQIGMALCAALEYFDPRHGGLLHGYTERRIVNVAGGYA